MPESHRAYHKTSCIGQSVKLKGSGSRERAVPRQATKEGSDKVVCHGRARAALAREEEHFKCKFLALIEGAVRINGA